MAEMFQEFHVCSVMTTKKIETKSEEAPQKRTNLHCCVWFDYLSILLLTPNKILSIVLSLHFQLLPHFSLLPHSSTFSIAKY